MRIVAVVLCIAALVSVAALQAVPRASGGHFLEQIEDPYKVQFISGNLTAAVTKTWPRVDFQHSDNLLSPMFEISMPRLFLFNDTNGDGAFSLSEAQYTGLMDDMYVKWNVSAIRFEQSAQAGEFATTSMSGWVSLYKGLTNQSSNAPAVRDWARLTFTFTIFEKNVTFSNSLGPYSVKGKTDLVIGMDFAVAKHVNANLLALEQQLQAGGSVNNFLVRERSANSNSTELTSVSSRNDERPLGLNYTHKILQTGLPTQDIDFANDRGTVQAYYRQNSEPTSNDSGTPMSVSMNSSYYTTGTSMMLYSVFGFGNRTDNLSHEMSIGLDMKGFVRVRDWAMRNLPVLAIVIGGLVVLGVVSAHAWRRKQRMTAERAKEIEGPLNKD